jgi:hypothetical protein
MCPMTLKLLLATATLLFSGVAAADVEKWVDPDGQVHYGDQPPSGADSRPVEVRPNVIEIERSASPTVIDKQPAQTESRTQTTAPEPRKDLEAYIKQCRENRGVDCEEEARQMIDGPAPVIFPGDPAVFPRPDVKPPPPGLPLKYGIKP